MRAEAVGAGLGDDPLRPHRDRGLGVRRKRHVAPVATLEVDAPESPRSAVLATELRHLGAGRQQRRRAGVAKLVEIDLVAAGLAQQPADPFTLCVLIDAAGVDHKPIRLPLSVVSWPPARGPALRGRGEAPAGVVGVVDDGERLDRRVRAGPPGLWFAADVVDGCEIGPGRPWTRRNSPAG